LAFENYYRDKFYAARNDLASDTGPMRDRLVSAYINYLHVVQSRFLVDEMKADFDELMRLLTQVQNERRGAVWASTRQMHWTQTKKCAQLIVKLATEADRRFIGSKSK